jgi:cell division septal protein FtsQ
VSGKAAVRRGLPPAAAGIPAPSDRRFRRSERPARRRTWRGWLRRAAWSTAGAVVVVLLASWAGSSLLDAAALTVRSVIVRGHSRVSAADIETRLAGIRQENILKIDLEQYRLRLIASPWIASAELWRVFPSTVQVRITERTPLVLARLSGQLFLVDAAGVIIGSFGPAYREFDLPIVDGLTLVAPDAALVDPARIRLVDRLMLDLAPRPDLSRRISQINVRDPRNAVILLDDEPAELRLGDRDFLARIEQFETSAAAIRHQRAVNEYWDLRFGDLVYVK